MLPELWTIPIIEYPIRSYGFMLMIGFFTAAYMAAKRAERVRANPDVVLNCAILALIGSMIGARLFYVIHYWDSQFSQLPNPVLAVIDISKGGMEFFGGLIGAIVVISFYLLTCRYSIRMYFDIMAPGLMWGLALTRIGCFLNGCCWGGTCAGTVAENWAVRFPYGSPAFYRQYMERQVKVPAQLLQADSLGRYAPLQRQQVFEDPSKWTEAARRLTEAEQEFKRISQLDPDSKEVQVARRKVEKLKRLKQDEDRQYAGINRVLSTYWSAEYPGEKITPSEIADLAHHLRTLPVQPVQLYGTISAFLGSLFLSCYFRVRKRHGMVFAMLLMTYPWTRIVLEKIRVDNPLDTFGLTISTAISIVMILLGAALMLWFRRLPLHSPLAVPWEPPAAQPESA